MFAARASCFTIKFYLFHPCIFSRLVLLPLCIFPLLCVTLWLFVPLCIPVVRFHFFIVSILYLFWEFSISMEMFCIIIVLNHFASVLLLFSLFLSHCDILILVSLCDHLGLFVCSALLCLLFASLCSFCMQLRNPAFVALHYFSYSASFLARL